MLQIIGSRVKLAEHVRNHWHVTAPEGTGAEDVVRPAFWSHVARQMRSLDRIEVVAETGEFYLDLLVEKVDATGVFVTVLNHVVRDAAPAEGDISIDGYRIEWKGPHHRFAVIRDADNTRLKDGIQKKTEAIRWAQDHAKAMAA